MNSTEHDLLSKRVGDDIMKNYPFSSLAVSAEIVMELTSEREELML